MQLTDAKGRMHTITLQAGQRFHTEKGGIDHDDLISAQEGIVVTSSKGTEYLALRPLLSLPLLALLPLLTTGLLALRLLRRPADLPTALLHLCGGSFTLAAGAQLT